MCFVVYACGEIGFADFENVDTLICLSGLLANVSTIRTAFIISPLRGKGLSSSNSSVLNMRASSMMHRGLHFNGVRGVRWSHSKSFAPPTFWWWSMQYPRVSSHDLASRVRVVVCSENDLLTKTENLGRFAVLPGIDISFWKIHRVGNFDHAKFW